MNTWINKRCVCVYKSESYIFRATRNERCHHCKHMALMKGFAGLGAQTALLVPLPVFLFFRSALFRLFSAYVAAAHVPGVKQSWNMYKNQAITGVYWNSHWCLLHPCDSLNIPCISLSSQPRPPFDLQWLLCRGRQAHLIARIVTKHKKIFHFLQRRPLYNV